MGNESMSENVDLKRLVALGLQVASEKDITADIIKTADALCKTDGTDTAANPGFLVTDKEFFALDKLHLGIILAIYGVVGIEEMPVDCVLSGVNYIARRSDKYRGTGPIRQFLREWVAGWQLADEWEDQNTGDDSDVVDAEFFPDEAPVATQPPYFEPGRYEGISNEDYHASNGFSSSQVKDARISLMYFHGRHITRTIQKESSDALTFGSLFHSTTLEPEKVAEEFSLEPVIPAGALTTIDSMKKFIEQYNATLPATLSSDEIKALLEAHNATLPAPVPLTGTVEELGAAYMTIPDEFRTIPGEAKHTGAAMKACIKQYNATLPVPLKTSGNREDLLNQLAAIDPDAVVADLAKPQPLNTSGKKEDLIAAIKAVAPETVFADDLIQAWQADTSRTQITYFQQALALAMAKAVADHPDAGPIIKNPTRAVEVSYYGLDDDTGLEIRVRPDLEIDYNGLRVGFDLKSVSMGRIKQIGLSTKLHREIIDRDYHVSAAMYCDLADLDQFFWIFVNKDEGYHWVAIVEASPDELELGRLEYKQTLRDIKNALDTDVWPAPITDALLDELNDFDLRRLQALRAA
jgi:exodeoxyribonuclease VIII